RGRIFRWCSAIDDLVVLTSNKPKDPGEVKSQADGIAARYDGYQAPSPQVAINKDGTTVLEMIASPPELPRAQRDAIDKKVLDGLPLTMPFADTPLVLLT